jgi:hypothetical protein
MNQNYSGNFGDFASFATHMRSLADSKGVDLLLVFVPIPQNSHPLNRR